MPLKKVLIITYYWPPSGGSGVQRWVKFAKYLRDFGWEPVILTVSNPTYPILDDSLQDEIHPNTKIYFSKSFEPYSILARLSRKSKEDVIKPTQVFSDNNSILKRFSLYIRANLFIPDARVGWVFKASKKAKSIVKDQNINIIITTGPPNSTHLIGKKLKSWNKDLSWIMDMRDPWSKIFYNESLPRTKYSRNLDLKLEIECLKNADNVLVISSGMEELQRQIHEREYILLENGFDHEDFIEISNSNDTRSSKLNISYIGSMTDSAIPRRFFDALAELSAEQRGKLEINFYGTFNTTLENLVSSLEVSSLINLNPYLAHLEAKKRMSEADFLLLVIPNTKENKLILTGKIFDYIAAQKPIICIGPKNGDAYKIIEDYNLGLNFEYEDKTGVSQFLANINKNNSYSYKPWEGDLKHHPFSRYSLTEKLSNILNEFNKT